MEKYKALESLVHLSNCNIGFIPSSPAEFNQLSAIISRKTGHSISVSSIKRLWGYVKYDNFPSRTTLNILAKFNDFKDWTTFLNEVSYDNKADATSSYVDNSLVNANTLNIGDILKLHWNNNKGCALEYISYLRFRVVEALNIKLHIGDTCTLSSVCVGLPLYISSIQHEDVIIPAYIGAKNGGVKTIEIIPRPQEEEEEQPEEEAMENSDDAESEEIKEEEVNEDENNKDENQKESKS